MSIQNTKLLPVSGIMSEEEIISAREIIAEHIGKKYKEFEEPYDIDVNFLFDHYDDGEGFSAEQYKLFIQWLIQFMCKPENAIALNKKFGSKGPEVIARLLEFFEGIVEYDDEDQMYAWLFWRNCRDNSSNIPTERIYSLWIEFVNPAQQKPTFK